MTNGPKPPAELTFETAMTELEEIVRRLEAGKATLDQAITDYARGAELKRFAEGKLHQAKAKIEQIAVAEDGKISTKPFHPDKKK